MRHHMKLTSLVAALILSPPAFAVTNEPGRNGALPVSPPFRLLRRTGLDRATEGILWTRRAE